MTALIGNVFRPTADEAGEVARLVGEGLVRRVALDVHVEADVPDCPSVRAEAVLAAATLTLGLAHVPLVGFQTAAFVHSGGPAPDRLHVVIAPGTSRPRAAGCISHEHRVPTRDVLQVGGLRVTTVARTAADLARATPDPDVGRLLDRLARHAGLRAVDVLAQLEGMPHGRGVARARDLVNAWTAALASR